MQELVCQVLFGVSQSVASVCFGSFVYAPSTSALLYLAALQYLKLIPRCLFSSRILSWLSMDVCLFRCHCSCYRQLFLQFLVMTSVQQCANRKAFGVMSLDFYAISLCFWDARVRTTCKFGAVRMLHDFDKQYHNRMHPAL